MIFYHNYHFSRLNLKGKAEKKRNKIQTALDNVWLLKIDFFATISTMIWLCSQYTAFHDQSMYRESLTIVRQTVFISHYCDIVLIISILVVIQFEILINSESDLLENSFETDHLLF